MEKEMSKVAECLDAIADFLCGAAIVLKNDSRSMTEHESEVMKKLCRIYKQVQRLRSQL